jgi:Flp pilus assembly protein TadD
MAADSLGKIGGKEAIAALGAAQTSRHGAIRDAAQEALSLIELRQVASNEEADAATLRKLAAAYIVKRDFAEAVYWLERAGSSDPTNAETHETLGTLHQKLGDHRRAERSYRKAIELAPQEPFPHFGVGTICHKRGDRAGAIAAFERYLELAPDGDQAASARGFLTELTQD